MFNNDCSDSSNLKEKISITELRKFKGLENVNETEAQEIIDGLYKLAMIGKEIIND